MAMQRPPLTTAESYNAAVQFHNHEFRTLGERTNAFLIFQSIFVAVTGVLFTSQQQFPIAFDILVLGIVIIGLAYCILHNEAGKSGAQAAFLWRKYLRKLENNQIDAPLKEFYKMYKEENYPEYLLRRIQLPSAWLTSPAIFIVVWFCILLYVILNYALAKNNADLAKFHQAPCWLFAILAFIAAITSIYAAYRLISSYLYWKAREEKDLVTPPSPSS